MLMSDSGKNRYILYPPSEVSEEPTIYQLRQLFSDLEAIAQLPDSALDVIIKFDYCTFLNHTAVAWLGGIARFIESRGGRMMFDWETLPRKIHMNLAQNGFLFDFGCAHDPWDGNSIPYWSNTQYNRQLVGAYLKDKWLGKGWVNISQGLQAAITGQVSEVYLNAAEHSQSPIGVFSCGQHYPRMGKLHLTVIDFGIGIPTSVRSLPKNASLDSAKALEWAFQSGTTTKQHGVSRGLGLSLLQDFITKNHGCLTIFSNDGCVTVNDNGVSYKIGETDFSGTLVNIALLCDEHYYCLASEVPSSEEPLF